MIKAETAVPADPITGSEASGETEQVTPNQDVNGEAEGEKQPEAKTEKTPEERERQRMQRGIDRRTRQLAEARAELEQVRRQLTPKRIQGNNQDADSDSEPLTLTRAQIAELVTAEAAKLAPTLREQATEVERRQGVVQSLAKTWGQERFDEVASDLDDAFGGLTDRSGKPKPATEAVFEADNPARVIEYLADHDNADEAESISRMSAAQAGKAIAKLEAKLEAEKQNGKPKPSKVPPPLEPIRGQGAVSGAPNPSDTKAWIRWRNEQERKGL